MHKLQINQQALYKAIYDDKNDDLQEIIREDGIDKNKRIEVYKNNVYVNLQETLQRFYPSIFALVGDEFFNYLCAKYIKKHKPTSGNLDNFGDKFSDFLNDFPEAKQLPYLPSIASLEWCLHLAYFAKDAKALSAELLSEITPEQLGSLLFEAHPSLHLASSEYPINKIWAVAIKKAEEESLDINGGSEYIAIVRPEYKIEQVLLSHAEYEFLKAIKSGNNLYQAFEAAALVDENFDFNIMLVKSVKSGFFTGFSYAE